MPAVRVVLKMPLKEFGVLVVKLEEFLLNNEEKILQEYKSKPKSMAEFEKVLMLFEGALYSSKFNSNEVS